MNGYQRKTNKHEGPSRKRKRSYQTSIEMAKKRLNNLAKNIGNKSDLEGYPRWMSIEISNFDTKNYLICTTSSYMIWFHRLFDVCRLYAGNQTSSHRLYRASHYKKIQTKRPKLIKKKRFK